jgi:hypothetical protein
MDGWANAVPAKNTKKNNRLNIHPLTDAFY